MMSWLDERVVIEAVWPEIDGGRHPTKRVFGDPLQVQADIFCDGHDALAACICWREASEAVWREAPMHHIDNDRWAGAVVPERNASYFYTIQAWRDTFATWRLDWAKKAEAGQEVALALREGRELVRHAAQADAHRFGAMLEQLDATTDEKTLAALLLDAALAERMHRHGPRSNMTRYRHELEVFVDRPAARFGAWYELFPRSASNDAQRHGTCDDVIARLPYVRELGFDVLYLTPIHPIGQSHRKGRNNGLQAGPADPGSPWAIGADVGGHTAIHPQLGTLADFRRLLAAARAHGMEIALDFAVQCSRDHPWITEHPEWFDWRPDGSIKYAENPPKKYEDIVNVHFYRAARPGLWEALRDVVCFWLEQGVRMFRVDNPHTKPVPFWEWLIRDIHARDPGVIFLAEAFTRPKMMLKLAKAGFTQSYTYFIWRNTKAELIEYMTELTSGVPCEVMRPHFFANTPDINPWILQDGNRAAFQTRATLAATLSSLWGIYSGFELCEHAPAPGREEYLDSEKYQFKVRDFDAPGNIRDFIARLNRIRRDNPALHDWRRLRFHPAHDEHLLFYDKTSANGHNVLWIAVNLDPHAAHEADIELPLYTLGLGDHASVDVEDLLEGHRFQWHGKWQRLRLDPPVKPVGIWRISRADA